jgi:CheY-like chemotaxis protein
MTKVAIFETDHAFAVELRTELTRMGCTVQVFKDGNTGLIATKTTPPDLILLSVELPRVNGFSICNKIKKDPTLAAIPLIIMSSQSSPETFEQHQRLPTRAEDYIHKPISFADFLPSIQRLCPIGPQGGIVDEDTGMVMDDEVLVVEDSSLFASVDDSALRAGGARRKTLELDHESVATQRQPEVVPSFASHEGGHDGAVTSARDPTFAEPSSDLMEDDEEIQTIVGARPSLPQELVERFMRDRQQQAAPTPFQGVPAAVDPRAASAASSAAWPAQPAWAQPAPVAGAPTDLQRAKNALQQALAQLNESRREVNALRAEAARSGGDRAALELREQLHQRDRELLELREALAERDRRALATGDVQLGFEKTLAELRERLAKAETERTTALTQVEALQADKSMSDKRATDFKAGARKIAEQLNQRAKELRDAYSAHGEEIERIKREHQAALKDVEQRHRDELAGAETAHRSELERVKGEGRAAVQSTVRAETAVDVEKAVEEARREAARERAEADRAAAAELEQKGARIVELEGLLGEAQRAREAGEAALAEEREKLGRAEGRARELEEAGAREVAEERESANRELTESNQRAQDALAAAEEARRRDQSDWQRREQAAHDENESLRSELATVRQSLSEREREVKELGAELEASRARERDLDASAKSARSDHEEILVQVAAQHREEAEKATRIHESQREQDLKSAAERHVRELKGFEETAQKQLDTLRVEHERAFAELHRELQEKLATQEATARAIEAQLGQDLAAARSTLEERKRELDAQHASWTAALQQRDEALTQLGAQHTELLQRARWLDNELGAARERLTVLEAQLDKARRRWGEDREALKQSKNALALIVRQLDEASVVGLEDEPKS